MRVGGQERLLGTLIVEPGAALGPGEAPLFGRHRDALVLGVAAARQRSLARIERDGGMAAHRRPAAQREGADAWPAGDEFRADEPGQRTVRVLRNRQVDQHPAASRQEIALPGEPDDRVAAAEQKTVAGIGERLRVVGRGGVVEELQCPLVAAIAVVEKQPAVAAGGIDGLQHEEIGGEVDEAVAVARREAEIGHALLRRRRRIDREMGAPDEALIGAGGAEFVPAGEGRSLGDLEFDAVRHCIPFILVSTTRGRRTRSGTGEFGRADTLLGLLPDQLVNSAKPAIWRAALARLSNDHSVFDKPF